MLGILNAHLLQGFGLQASVEQADEVGKSSKQSERQADPSMDIAPEFPSEPPSDFQGGSGIAETTSIVSDTSAIAETDSAAARTGTEGKAGASVLQPSLEQCKRASSSVKPLSGHVRNKVVYREEVSSLLVDFYADVLQISQTQA